MKWEIKLYKKTNGEYPVLDYILALSPKQRAKIEKGIDLLELHGISLPYPYKRKIRGVKYKDLWELRIKSGRSQLRIIYFLCKQNIFVLVSAFCKKRNKTPRNELEIAKNRMVEYISRMKD
jgi:phage-related protein